MCRLPKRSPTPNWSSTRRWTCRSISAVNCCWPTSSPTWPDAFLRPKRGAKRPVLTPRTRSEVPFQLLETLLPLRAHPFHPGGDVGQSSRPGRVLDLATSGAPFHQTGLVEGGEVLGDRLTRHRHLPCETRR